MRRFKLMMFVLFIVFLCSRIVTAQTPDNSSGGLVSLWTFDEASGTTANDALGGNPGTLTNGASFITGLVGNAVCFDGASSRIDVTDSPNLRITEQITIETLINREESDAGHTQPIVGKWGNGDNCTGSYGLFLWGDGPWFVITTTGCFPNGYYDLKGPSLSPNQWHHVVGTYDGSEMKLYVDGDLVLHMPVSGSIYPAPGIPVVMGHYNPAYTNYTNPGAPSIGPSIKGRIDNAAIYNTALDATTIQQRAQMLLSVQPPDNNEPPAVSLTSPASGETGVAVNSAITASFSERMDTSTITATTFTVSDGVNTIPGTISYNCTTVTFTPSNNLSYATTYTVTINTGAKDLAGNAMASDYTWSFTTGIMLTGLVEFSTDSTGAGHPIGANVWNTLGGDPIRNLYVTLGSSLDGEFVNTGNDTSTSVAIVLSPGTHTFRLWAESATWIQADFHGLNLFFNGNNTNPEISVFAPTDMALPTPPGPAFSANTSTITWDLARTWYEPVPGAGTLSFVYRSTTVTLTDYFWSFPDVFNTDRIQGFDSGAGEGFDFVGGFTLQVSGPPVLNVAPVANAGADQSVYVGNTVTLDGSGSADVDGNLLTYSWAFASKPSGSTATLNNQTSVNPTFTVDVAGTYVASLIVNDGTVNSTPDTVTVSTLNSAPVASAGADQSIILIGSTIQLDGSQSYDPDGEAITYQWSFTSVPAGSSAILEKADTATPTFVADVRGEYVAQLLVSDASTQSTTDTVTISFENVKPIANPGTSQSVTVGTTVPLDGSGSADANGDTLTYQWTLSSVPTGSSASIADPDAKITSFVSDVAGTYVVQLVVNDGYIDSNPSTIQVQAVISPTTPITIIQNLQSLIMSLNPNVFKNANMQNTLINKLNAVMANIESGNYADALDQLQNDILKKTDGCATNRTPDKNDWITDCNAQGVVYPSVIEAITAIGALL